MSDQPLSDLAKRIDWLLQKLWAGSQSRMAGETGVSQSAISNVTTGRQQPGRKMLEKIAAVPVINLPWLLSGQGQPFINYDVPPRTIVCFTATDPVTGKVHSWRFDRTNLIPRDGEGIGLAMINDDDNEIIVTFEVISPPMLYYYKQPLEDGTTAECEVDVSPVGPIPQGYRADN